MNMQQRHFQLPTVMQDVAVDQHIFESCDFRSSSQLIQFLPAALRLYTRQPSTI